jgi:hypothetical protein
LDIFTQAGRALTRPSGSPPLGELEAQTLIATGQSQSAAFLISYINGVQRLAKVFDGFLLHASAQPGRIRPDLDQPTFVFVTESEITGFGFTAARQPDSKSVRTWEVAGAAHGDIWETDGAGGGYAASCPSRIRGGPHTPTFRAALHRLVAWARTGAPPPVARRIELADPEQRRAVVIERDEHGNAVGGVRTPYVDVPVAALSGDAAPDSSLLCRYFGSTTPFDAATLARLYPDHESYVAKFTASTEAAVKAGFILRPEADEMIAAAVESAIGSSAA